MIPQKLQQTVKELRLFMFRVLAEVKGSVLCSVMRSETQSDCKLLAFADLKGSRTDAPTLVCEVIMKLDAGKLHTVSQTVSCCVLTVLKGWSRAKLCY